jgi:hypothetical protein
MPEGVKAPQKCLLFLLAGRIDYQGRETTVTAQALSEGKTRAFGFCAQVASLYVHGTLSVNIAYCLPQKSFVHAVITCGSRA